MPVDTALHKACHNGDINDIKKVYDEHDPDEDPIDVNAAGAQDRRPLHRAAGGNHVAAVKFLIEEKGATVDQVDKPGRTPFHWAAMGGHVDAGGALLDAGAKIDAATTSGMTAMHAACEAGHTDFVNFLLERAPDKLALCTVKDGAGKVPCDLAVAGKYKAVVKALQGAGDPVAQSSSCVIC